jgi:signal transduction histidine kinase/ligand-binding sensor domain-containing protein
MLKAAAVPTPAWMTKATDQSWCGAPSFSMRNSLAIPHDCRSLFRRWIRFAVTFCLSLPCAWATWAVDSSTASQYIRTDFTVDDGLPDNTVNAITETANGLLWVGTESGLASFDGRTFTPVRLRIAGAPPPSIISSLVEGPDGDLWVGSDAGIIRIPKRDLNDPNLTNATAFRLGEHQSDEVEVLYRARDGSIWAGTSHGLFRFDGSRFLPVNSSIYVGRIEQALNGHFMLNTGSGFLEYDGQRFIQHPGLGAQFGVHDDQIFDAYQAADGTVWYCTEKGIRALAGQRARFLDPYEPSHTPAYRIYTDPVGALWVNTKIGIYRVAGDHLWTPVPDLHARGFYAGQDGELWIGTNGSGLVHLRPRAVQMFAKTDGLPSDIAMAVLPAHDGQLWVGANCGLAVFDGSHFRTFDEKDGLTNACVWSLAEDRRHTLWIGTYGGGLFQYKNGVFTQYTIEQGFVSRIVFQIAVARDDSLWVATPNGVSHVQDGRIRNYTTTEGLSSPRVLAIHQDRAGTIWVATQAGVERLDSDRFIPVTSTQPVDEVLARHFVEDSRGNLYTTDMPRGISQIRNGHLTPIDTTLALMNMAEGPDRTMWFSSRNDVIRIAEQEFERAGNSDAPLDYEVFNRADGLNTTEASVGTPNIALTPDGKLWIATVKGLAMIDTSRLPRAGRQPKIFVDGVSSDGRTYVVGDGLLLRPGIHQVELHLAAINLSNPQKIRLQYRMEGVDSDWLDGTSSRTAIYTSLPAGTHRLLVRATDSGGHWNAPEVVYEITQQPRLYAKPLFQGITVIGLALLLVLAYVMRVRYVVRQARIIIEQRQMERGAVARDLHDTFLQGVQALILRFHTATKQLPQNHPVRRMFEETLKQSDAVMAEGRELLVDLHATTSKRNDLATTLANYGEHMQEGRSGTFNVAINGDSQTLHPIVYEELARIGKEALGNAFRHSTARSIEAELNYEPNELRMRIRDDGMGIDPNILKEGSRDGHLGLASMRERARNIGAQLDLWSRAGSGTEIELRIPADLAYVSENNGKRRKFWQQRGGKNDHEVGQNH